MKLKFWIVLAVAGLVAVLAGLAITLDEPPPETVTKMQVMPITSMQAVNLGPVINTKLREAEASFTADGKTMYFNCETRIGRGGNDICVSHLTGTIEDGHWSKPEIVAPGVISLTDTFEVEPLISRDGNTLYFMSSGRSGATGGNDIWVSEKVNGVWQKPDNLGPPFNSTDGDHCLAFSSDGNEAYWTSTRPGGFGLNDIWTAQKIDGVWQRAVNMGRNVNSKNSEHHSTLSPDGKSLFVTSSRPGGLGGDDIYVTTRDSTGTWGPLMNLGPLVNSDKNDRCGAFTPDARFFLFDSDRKGGQGDKDLWWVYYNLRQSNP
jgi:hypothetical protein